MGGEKARSGNARRNPRRRNRYAHINGGFWPLDGFSRIQTRVTTRESRMTREPCEKSPQYKRDDAHARLFTANRPSGGSRRDDLANIVRRDATRDQTGTRRTAAARRLRAGRLLGFAGRRSRSRSRRSCVSLDLALCMRARARMYMCAFVANSPDRPVRAIRSYRFRHMPAAHG